VNHIDKWVKKDDIKDGITFSGVRQNPNNSEYEHTLSPTQGDPLVFLLYIIN